QPRHDPAVHQRSIDTLHQQRGGAGNPPGQGETTKRRMLANPDRTGRLRDHLVLPVHRGETRPGPPRRPHPTLHHRPLAPTRPSPDLIPTPHHHKHSIIITATSGPPSCPLR